MAQNEPLIQSPQDTGPLIRRGRVETIFLYEIKDNELDMLETGPKTEYLTFFALFVGVAVTAWTTVATATFQDSNWKTAFISGGVVCSVLSLVFIGLWIPIIKRHKRLCTVIRERTESKSIRVTEQSFSGPQSPTDDVKDVAQ